MTLEKTLLLSLVLGAAACGDNGTATSDTASATGTGSTGGTTEAPTTNNPTTTPTSTPTTGDASSTVDPTGETQGPTTDATGTSTTGDTASTGSTTDSTGPVLETTGTSTTGDTTGTTADASSGSTTDLSSSSSGSSSTGDTMGVVEATIYEVQNGTIKEMEPVDVKGVIVTGISATKIGEGVEAAEGGEGAYLGAAEIDVDECPTPKVSYSLSQRRGKPLMPPSCFNEAMASRRPVRILCG